MDGQEVTNNRDVAVLVAVGTVAAAVYLAGKWQAEVAIKSGTVKTQSRHVCPMSHGRYSARPARK